MSETTQPMPKPATVDEYERIRGELIDTLGNPVVRAWCQKCRCEHFTVDPCVAEVPCPRCDSRAMRSRRPSGHEAGSWHAERVKAFDRLRDEMEAAGMPQVAKWPEPRDLGGGLLDLLDGSTPG